MKSLDNSAGRAKGLQTAIFTDWEGRGLDIVLNDFFTSNPNFEILNIQFQYKPNPEQYIYGGECALVVYRDTDNIPPPPPPPLGPPPRHLYEKPSN